MAEDGTAQPSRLRLEEPCSILLPSRIIYRCEHGVDRYAVDFFTIEFCRVKFLEPLLEAGFITQEEMNQALAEARKHGRPEQSLKVRFL